MKTLTALAFALSLTGMGGAWAQAQTLSQPKEERAAQNALPMSHDSVWGTLLKAKIAYSNKAPYITAAIPPEVKAMNGKTVTVSGFVLPFNEELKPTHFLLSKRTPTCPFCPPGEPNEVVEVYSKKAVEWNQNLLTMKGTFTLINNTDNGIFFVLKNAEPVGGAEKFTVPMMGGKNLM